MPKAALYFALLVLMPVVAVDKPLQGAWDLQESLLGYTVEHPFKKATGTSRAAKGKVRCSTRDCEALIAVAVNTFDSGDSNRDLHMLEATRGAAYPIITVRTRFTASATEGELRTDLQVEFAGEKVTIENVAITIKKAGTGLLETTGQFTLRLSDFKIAPPSLLGMAIKNEVPLKFRAHWRRQ